MLAHAQQLPSAAHFQIAHRDRVACPELRVFCDDLQPFLPLHRGQTPAVAEEISVRPLSAASHPPSQLIELRQAEGVAAVHD